MIAKSVVILMCSVAFATANESYDLVRKGNNVVAVESLGKFHGGVKMGYLKMTLDSNPMYDGMAKLDKDFDQLPDPEKRKFLHWRVSLKIVS